MTNDLFFCDEHAREFKRRQRKGVNTSELEPSWGGTLENWRERPSELDKETQFKFLTTPFMFRQYDEPWLIFECSYDHITLPS